MLIRICRSGTTVPYVVERIISQGHEINDHRFVAASTAAVLTR